MLAQAFGKVSCAITSRNNTIATVASVDILNCKGPPQSPEFLA